MFRHEHFHSLFFGTTKKKSSQDLEITSTHVLHYTSNAFCKSISKIYGEITRRDSQMLKKKKRGEIKAVVLDVLCKKGFLKNFAKFTGKHLHLGLFLMEQQALNLKFYEKETSTQMLPYKFCESFDLTSRRLLLFFHYFFFYKSNLH